MVDDMERTGFRADGRGSVIERAKFEIDIEGALKPWDKDEITTEEIADLGGWDPSLGVLRVNLEDGTEEALEPGQIVKVTPGIAFGKRVLFKRG